jgi:hypothetical protein
MSIADEMRRVAHGPTPDERPMLSDRVAFTGDTDAVISTAKAVLLAVLTRVDDWPADDEWPLLLPASFVSMCAPEMTDEEAEQWLTRWQRLSPEGQAIEADESWSLLRWLHWFDPSGDGANRGWSWWDTASEGPRSGSVEIAIDSHPYASGSLRWLLRASGATSIG